MGMIDESEVPERMQESPTQAPAPMENTLFVSDEDNTTPAPTVEIVATSLDSDVPLSASPTKNIFNPFQQTMPTPSPSPFGNPPQAPQPTAPAVVTQPPNPFSSMFSGTQASKQVEPAPVNPFAAKPVSLSSPFAFPKPAETTQPAAVSTAPSIDFSKPAVTEVAKEGTPIPSPFALPKPAETAEKVRAPASPFAFPKPAETGVKAGTPPATSPLTFPKSAPTIEQNGTPVTTSPFAFPNPAAQTEKEITPAASPNPFAASLSSFVPPKPLESAEDAAPSPFNQGPPQPSTSSTLFPSTSSPFTFPSTTPPVSQTPPPPSIFTEASAIQKTSTVLEPAKPSPLCGFEPTSLFQTPKAPEAEQKKIEDAKETSVPVSQQLSQLSTTASSTTPKLFGSTAGPPVFSTLQNQKPLFPASSPPASQDAVTEPSPIQGNEPMFAKPAKPKQDEAVLQKLPPTEVPAKSPEPVEPALTVSQLEQSTSSLSSTQSSVDSENLQWRPPQTEEEEAALFKRIMRRAEEKAKRKEDRLKRKRAQEEQALADSMREERLKVSTLSPPAESPPPAKNFSLAESSIKALPTLPCLERAKALLEKKPASEADTEAGKKRQREIDEDEMLLNSARIVAEQLRTGPKIFDDMSPQSLAEYNAYHAYWEERGKRARSYSNSLSPSMTPYAQSASPPQFPRHAYDVAYAPDTPQGLGRTMSRTEHRIRMTGGHGLAYKPLDFSRSNSREKDKHQDKEKGKAKSRFAMRG
jgi:hypothetical protein